MKTKYIVIIGAVVCAIIYLAGMYFSPKVDKDVNALERIEHKIDSLSLKKDSIKTVIITVEKEIIKNRQTHEKIVDSIIIQSSSADSVFARDYIKKFINERVRWIRHIKNSKYYF